LTHREKQDISPKFRDAKTFDRKLYQQLPALMQIGIRPSIVVTFCQIPSTGVGAVAFNRRTLEEKKRCMKRINKNMKWQNKNGYLKDLYG